MCGVKKRGQAAMEYLIIAGFALAIVSVLTIIYFTQNEENKLMITTTQADRITKKLADTAEEVYFLGKPTATTVKVYIPSSVENIEIGNYEILFQISTASGIIDIEQPVTVNVTGTITASEGVKHIHLKSHQGYVCIYEAGSSCP